LFEISNFKKASSLKPQASNIPALKPSRECKSSSTSIHSQESMHSAAIPVDSQAAAAYLNRGPVIAFHHAGPMLEYNEIVNTFPAC
jgi:hypothetical protein